MEPYLDVINVDTVCCVGRSGAGCIWGRLLSELMIPRTFPEAEVMSTEPYLWKQMQDELEKY